MKRKTLMCMGMALLVAACSGGPRNYEPPPAGSENALTVRVQNNFNAAVEVSSLWQGTRVPTRLGNVGRGEELEFTFFYRAGDLRIVVESVATRRTTTSNAFAVSTSWRGKTLNLVIDSSFEVDLGAPSGGGEH